MRVLNKAIQIVDLLAASPQGLRLKDVADSLGFDKATALRVLRALESLDLARRDHQARFFIGNRILWWEAYQRQSLDFRTAVRSTLDRLRELTSETASFSVSISDRMVIVGARKPAPGSGARCSLAAASPIWRRFRC